MLTEMRGPDFKNLRANIQKIKRQYRIGRVSKVNGSTITVTGLADISSIGDKVQILARNGNKVTGEVTQIGQDLIHVYPEGRLHGVVLNDRVKYLGASSLAPDHSWLGRIVDPDGRPLDGYALMNGIAEFPLQSDPPSAANRRGLGQRLDTGMCVFNTLLPLAKGQRLGLFAGSGVGKSTLLAKFARHVQVDVIVIAQVGERGRELREFTDKILGAEGMKRSVLVAATSDQSAILRRRCAWSAMTIAEYFRNAGAQVLFLMDSVTRFAEAHREIALANGEAPSIGGFPPSVVPLLMSLAERAGPGDENSGDITAVFSVLVPGSDMEGPIADVLRGTLDGHVVLDRQIAERGRFPAIDVLRSVSRSLPDVCTEEENELLSEFRTLLGTYDRAELMLQSGLYTEGSDPQIDRSAELWPKMDEFISKDEYGSAADSFQRLKVLLADDKKS